MPTFVPSVHSGVIARPNSTAGDVAGTLLLGPVYWVGKAVSNIALTKDAKFKKASEKELKYRLSYEKCKGRRLKKGKQAYPQDPSTSAFSSNCHVDYKKWKAWEQKLADRARELQSKLEQKGKLTESLNEDFERVKKLPRERRKSELEEAAAQGLAMEEAALMADSAALMEAQAELDAIPEEEGMGLTPFLLVGGIVALAGGAYYFMSKGD